MDQTVDLRFQLRREAEAVLARLEGVDDLNRQNLEKIVGLEEAHVTQLEKAVYVESLASRVSAIDEAKQMVNLILLKKLHLTKILSIFQTILLTLISALTSSR